MKSYRICFEKVRMDPNKTMDPESVPGQWLQAISCAKVSRAEHTVEIPTSETINIGPKSAEILRHTLMSLLRKYHKEGMGVVMDDKQGCSVSFTTLVWAMPKEGLSDYTAIDSAASLSQIRVRTKGEVFRCIFLTHSVTSGKSAHLIYFTTRLRTMQQFVSTQCKSAALRLDRAPGLTRVPFRLCSFHDVAPKLSLASVVSQNYEVMLHKLRRRRQRHRRQIQPCLFFFIRPSNRHDKNF